MDAGFPVDKILLDLREGGMAESSSENVDVILDGPSHRGDATTAIKEDWVENGVTAAVQAGHCGYIGDVVDASEAFWICALLPWCIPDTIDMPTDHQ